MIIIQNHIKYHHFLIVSLWLGFNWLGMILIRRVSVILMFLWEVIPEILKLNDNFLNIIPFSHVHWNIGMGLVYKRIIWNRLIWQIGNVYLKIEHLKSKGNLHRHFGKLCKLVWKNAQIISIQIDHVQVNNKSITF